MFTSWLWPGCARRAGTAARSAALGRAAVSEEPRPSPHQRPAQTWRLLLVMASAWLSGSQCCQVWGLLRNVRCSVVSPAPSDWWLATSDLLPTTEIASRTSWAECGAVCVSPVPSCVSVQRPSSLSISSSAAVKEVARAFASFPLLRCRNHLYYEVLYCCAPHLMWKLTKKFQSWVVSVDLLLWCNAFWKVGLVVVGWERWCYTLEHWRLLSWKQVI